MLLGVGTLLYAYQERARPDAKAPAAVVSNPRAANSFGKFDGRGPANKRTEGPVISKTLAVRAPDSIGRFALATWKLSNRQWDSLRVGWDLTGRLVRNQMDSIGKFRVMQAPGERPRLFHWVAAGDSSWSEIDLALPVAGEESAEEMPDWGAESGSTSLDTINLDGRGAPEVVIRFHPASYGSGGGTAWDYVSVLDVTSTPTLIFQALLASEEEAFGGYAAMHGYQLPPGEQFTGCKRSFGVRRRELVLGPIQTIGNTKRADCSLTRLPAGRYCYRGGKVFRAGQ